MSSKKYRVKLILSYEFTTEVESDSKELAVDNALDEAMDYLDITLSDSQKFNEFWEYSVNHKIHSVEEF